MVRLVTLEIQRSYNGSPMLYVALILNPRNIDLDIHSSLLPSYALH